MKTTYGILCLSAAGLLSFSQAAKADSVDPATYSQAIDVGASVVVHKVVTVDSVPPVSAPVDVFLLSDTTGSMYGAISAVMTSASAIIASTAGSGDVWFGAGEYKDVGDVFVYRTNTDMTNSVSAVQAGVNMWAASGGGDWEEAELYALQQIANTVSWRPSSTRILVWFGDAPGHDPTQAGVTETSATASLVAKAIKVEALDMGAAPYGLDAYGQATRITAATHGQLYTGVSTSSIVATIQASIHSALVNYYSVNLDLSGVPAGIVATSTSGYTGTWVRDVARPFTFDVTFKGTTVGTYNFNIPVLVDSGKVATESDSITVRSTTLPPTPPKCALTATIAGPPKKLQITVQDPDNGLKSVAVTEANNVTVAVPTFTAGDKSAMVVVATKVDQSKSAQVALRLTDVNGAITDCDPIVPGDPEATDDPAAGAGCSVAWGKSGLGLSSLFGALVGLALLRRRQRRA
jgi:hypothetical protein